MEYSLYWVCCYRLGQLLHPGGGKLIWSCKFYQSISHPPHQNSLLTTIAQIRLFNEDFEDTPLEERAVLGPGLRGGWSIGEQIGIFRPDPVTPVHGQCALVTLDQPQSTFERFNVDLSGYATNNLILSYSYYQQFYPISCNVNVKFFDTAIDTFTMPSNIGVWADRWTPFTPADSSGALRFEVSCDGPGARIWWDNIGIRENTVARNIYSLSHAGSMYKTGMEIHLLASLARAEMNTSDG